MKTPVLRPSKQEESSTSHRETPNDSNFRIGQASVSIVPSGPLIDWITRENYPGVLDPIQVQALVLEEGDTRAVLISFDLLETRSSQVAELRALLEKDLGIPAGHILMQATHVHSAPRFPHVKEDAHPTHLEKLAEIQGDPGYQVWCRELPEKVLRCARAAVDSLQPATAGIRRIYAGDWVYNRRPIQPDGRVTTLFSTKTPFAQPDGNRFGVCDPTLTALQFQGAEANPLATLLHFACHPVAIYPTDQRLSADWPGFLKKKVSEAENATTLFLQGCAGDQVPVRRGLAAVEEMTDVLAGRLQEAVASQGPLVLNGLAVRSAEVELPLIPHADAPASIQAEVQVIVFGEVAIVAMPGEILIGIGLEIQRRSPFPHTLCLGYANGHGTAYTGLPIEKERGGYEGDPKVSHGTAECGSLLIETACSLLQEMHREDSVKPNGDGLL